jgi:rubrerythrin
MVVNRVFRSFRVEGYFECRRCGRTLEGPVDACGACGAEDVAHYPPWVFESRE